MQLGIADKKARFRGISIRRCDMRRMRNTVSGPLEKLRVAFLRQKLLRFLFYSVD